MTLIGAFIIANIMVMLFGLVLLHDARNDALRNDDYYDPNERH